MIRKLSKKRSKQHAEYIRMRNAYIYENPTCKVCLNGATEIHHKKGRMGILLTDIRYFLPVCRACHNKIEQNPIWAIKMDYSLSRLHD